MDEHNVKEQQFYLICESFKHNLLQSITIKQSVDQSKFFAGANYFTEQEMRHIVSTLIDIFGDLQRKKIAHRNIKPANIVVLDQNHMQLRVCNFELAAEVNREGD